MLGVDVYFCPEVAHVHGLGLLLDHCGGENVNGGFVINFDGCSRLVMMEG